MLSNPIIFPRNQAMSRPLKTFLFWNFSIIVGLLFTLKTLDLLFPLPSLLKSSFFLVACLSSFFAAVISAQKYYGPRGKEKLNSTFSKAGLHGPGLSIAISPLAFLFIGLLLYPLFFEQYFTLNTFIRSRSITGIVSLIGWVFPILGIAVSDTFGWRSFALPHWQVSSTAFSSSILIGILNGFSLILLMNFQYPFDLLFSIRLLLFSIFQSFLLTAIFNYSKGNSWPCLIFSVSSYFTIVVDSEFLMMVTTIGYVLISAYLINQYGRVHLCEGHRVKNFYKKVMSSKLKSQILDLEEDSEI